MQASSRILVEEGFVEEPWQSSMWKGESRVGARFVVELADELADESSSRARAEVHRGGGANSEDRLKIDWVSQ